MKTAVPKTTTNLIEALRAFLAEQGRTASVGLVAAAEMNDPAARAALEAINAEVDTVLEALKPAEPRFDWSSPLYTGMTDLIPGLDPLVDFVDRAHPRHGLTPPQVCHFDTPARRLQAPHLRRAIGWGAALSRLPCRGNGHDQYRSRSLPSSCLPPSARTSVEGGDALTLPARG